MRGATLLQWLLLAATVIVGAVVGMRTLGISVNESASAVARSLGSPGEHGALKGAEPLRPGGDTITCFVAGTPVLTSRGPVAIEDVRPGDLVLSRDEATGAMVEEPVTRTFEREASGLVDVEVAGDVVRSTAAHPYWVAERGWTGAGDVRAGDRLVDVEGHERDVTAVRGAEESVVARVYNLEVAVTHTYFAGAASVWVHNACGTPPHLPAEMLVEITKYPLHPETALAMRLVSKKFRDMVDETHPEAIGSKWAVRFLEGRAQGNRMVQAVVSRS